MELASIGLIEVRIIRLIIIPPEARSLDPPSEAATSIQLLVLLYKEHLGGLGLLMPTKKLLNLL
jgi:hypothetical protein